MLKVGDRVLIRSIMAFGERLERQATVVRYNQAPDWCPERPFILVRPDGWKHDLAPVRGEVFRLDGTAYWPEAADQLRKDWEKAWTSP